MATLQPLASIEPRCHLRRVLWLFMSALLNMTDPSGIKPFAVLPGQLAQHLAHPLRRKTLRQRGIAADAHRATRFVDAKVQLDQLAAAQVDQHRVTRATQTASLPSR